jgi:hypothetical protein
MIDTAAEEEDEEQLEAEVVQERERLKFGEGGKLVRTKETGKPYALSLSPHPLLPLFSSPYPSPSRLSY